MKDRLRIIGLAAAVTACGPAVTPPIRDTSYRSDLYRMSYNVPTLFGGGSGFTCYTDTLPKLIPAEADQVQVTLIDASCDNNNPGWHTPLEEIGVTPGRLTETIIFTGEADQITVVSQ
ncbi:MAG: hypothetical protein US51_C0046G0009 [Microgenomates group bacterium GW2011_GWA2_37_6]|nr:MAG: hypothetical protein US51_C0046G0009 [Microgenomates group bacterium GW2011_GWA2_37_6]